MPITGHVDKGSILWCDFNAGFKEPEMVKRRLVVVISPKIQARPNLCTVVALSTTAPNPVMPYHAQIDIVPPLSKPLQSNGIWIKGDMVYAVGFHRLDLLRTRDRLGRRVYYYKTLSQDQMKIVHKCLLHGMGLSALTSHL